MPPVLVTLPLLFLVSCALVRIYQHLALRYHWFDQPGERSSHTVPTPTGAGLMMVLAWVGFCILAAILEPAWRPLLLPLLPGVVILSVVGFLDDLTPLGAGWRLIIHFAAATLFLYGLYQVTPEYGFNPLVDSIKLVLLVWSINLFNFMDGTDGLAASEGIAVLLTGGLLAGLAGGQELSLLSWSLALCAGGFLVWNWPRASVFMGDAGSVVLGFMVAALALLAERIYGLPLALWLIPYALFWFDGGMTLMRRILSGEAWYRAHRSHAYQRLHHKAGWSHRRILLWAMIINLLLGLAAIIAYTDEQLIPWALLFSLLLCGGVYLWIESRAPMYDPEPERHNSD